MIYQDNSQVIITLLWLAQGIRLKILWVFRNSDLNQHLQHLRWKMLATQEEIPSFSQKKPSWTTETSRGKKNHQNCQVYRKKFPSQTNRVFLRWEYFLYTLPTSVSSSSTYFTVLAGGQRLMSCLGKYFEETARLQTSAPGQRPCPLMLPFRMFNNNLCYQKKKNTWDTQEPEEKFNIHPECKKKMPNQSKTNPKHHHPPQKKKTKLGVTLLQLHMTDCSTSVPAAPVSEGAGTQGEKRLWPFSSLPATRLLPMSCQGLAGAPLSPRICTSSIPSSTQVMHTQVH